MISSTSPSDRSSSSDIVSDSSQTSHRHRVRPDRISMASAAKLSDALDNNAEVRPEMVERGRKVMNDPSYPMDQAVSNIAAQIVNSPDLSEDPS